MFTKPYRKLFILAFLWLCLGTSWMGAFAQDGGSNAMSSSGGHVADVTSADGSTGEPITAVGGSVIETDETVSAMTDGELETYHFSLAWGCSPSANFCVSGTLTHTITSITPAAGAVRFIGVSGGIGSCQIISDDEVACQVPQQAAGTTFSYIFTVEHSPEVEEFDVSQYNQDNLLINTTTFVLNPTTDTTTVTNDFFCSSASSGCRGGTLTFTIDSVTPGNSDLKIVEISGLGNCEVTSDTVAVCEVPETSPGQEWDYIFIIEYAPEVSQFTIAANFEGSALNVVSYDLPGLPDVGGLAIDAFDNISGGATQVNFTIANIGTGDAGAFDVDIVFSDDDVIDINDQVVGMVTINGLPDGQQINRSTLVTLPIDLQTLRSQAIATYPPGLSNVNVTQPIYYIGLSVDTANNLVEIDETNNVNNGPGFDIDAVGYFPWDFDGNGIVDEIDVNAVTSRIGLPVTGVDSLADINRDGDITPTDAIEVANRAGYQVEFDLNE